MTVLSLLLALLSSPAHAVDTAPPEVKQGLERMRTATAALTEYSYTFRRHEWKDGKQLDAQLMAVKFRKPLDVYLTWTGDVHTGRELIFRRGWNDDKLHVKPSPSPLVPTLNLDPSGKLAMRGSRHGIEMIDLGNVTALILAQTDRLAQHATLEATYTDQGQQDVHGEPSRCVRVDLPKDQDPALYGHRVDMCVSQATGLLTRLRTWDHEDGQVRKVEDYEFRDMDTSPGLTDADFDPDNPAYGF